MTVTIYTHSKTFHPDELLAIALLQSTMLEDDKVDIVRTRDEKILEKAKADPNAFVIDVGFSYDPSARNFDHHQDSMTSTWPDGTPYSACGLIWIWLREQGSLASWGSADVLDEIEERLIRLADRYDNGIGGEWGEGEFLAAYNRPATSETRQRAAFDRALAVAADLLDNTVAAVEKEMQAASAVRLALSQPNDALNDGILLMDEHRSDRYAYWAARLGQGQVKLLVVPRADGMWTLVTPPRDLADPFSILTPAPRDWRGRGQFTVHAEMSEVTIAFCHKNGFLSVVAGDKGEAMAVARLICQSTPPALYAA